MLPEGERMIWQGAPDAIGLAIRAFHVRKVAVYFLILMVWRFGSAKAGGQDIGASLGYALGVLPLALAAIAVLSLIAWGYARTSFYTLTSKRLVLRSGIALPITLNLPFSKVTGVSFKSHADGSGDIALKVPQDERIAAMLVWPHMRPWSWTYPQPMLRSVPDAAAVAQILMAELGDGAPAERTFLGKDAATGDRAMPVGAHA
jgi:hypothetical protein